MDEIALAQKRLALLDYIPLGAFVLREDFRVIFWNKYLEQWTTINRETILGKSLEHFYPHLKHNKYAYRLQQLFQNGLPTIFSSELHQSLLPCLIGQYKLQVQHTTATPISCFNGKGYYALFILQDVTEITDRLRKFKTMEIRALEEVKQRESIQKKLEERNCELEKLNEISKLLQSCNSVEEAYKILDTHLKNLFQRLSGGLLIYNNEGEIKQITHWERGGQKNPFDPSKHRNLWEGNKEVIQPHCFLGDLEYCFFPLIANAKNLGSLYLIASETQKLSDSQKLFAVTVCEQMALILANLKLRESLEHLSIRDHLTGLYNRRYLDDRFKKELARAKRNNQAIGIILLDIDHFTYFNNTFGHQIGDLVLQKLGQFLRENTRSYDIVCRYGGEEFIIILPEVSLVETASRAEGLSQEIKKISVEPTPSRIVNITVSMGVSCFPEHGTSSAALILAADLALYRAKREGRDRVVCATLRNF